MNSPSTGNSSLRDVIVTLPMRSIVALVIGVVLASVGFGLLAYYGSSESIQSAGTHGLVLLVPFAGALVAAIGVRRTSTAQIDRLIDEFLENTVLERLKKWCATKPQVGLASPFREVNLLEPVRGRSYAFFQLIGRDGNVSRDIGVKVNVFNFELFTHFDVFVEDATSNALARRHILIDKITLNEMLQHPILRQFAGSLQGSVDEGYSVRVTFGEPRKLEQGTIVDTHWSFRMKLKENFLTSPFLKRYFSEDAAILVNVLFTELDRSRPVHVNVNAL